MLKRTMVQFIIQNPRISCSSRQPEKNSPAMSPSGVSGAGQSKWNSTQTTANFRHPQPSEHRLIIQLLSV